MLDMSNAGVNIDKPLLFNSNAINWIFRISASGVIAGGSSTTGTGHMSPTSGHPHTSIGTASGKVGQFAKSFMHMNQRKADCTLIYRCVYWYGFNSGGWTWNMV